MNERSQGPVIAVDAMGGDHGPETIVPGAVQALASAADFGIALYGDEAAIAAQLKALDADQSRVGVVHCSENIDMSDSPAAAIRGKPDSPIARAMRDQKEGRVQAVVSAGSTGAMVAAGLLVLGRLPSVDRPAIATLVPTLPGELLLLDAGANVQCSAEHLLSFARMGELYVREMLDIAAPTVGLLNIGEEESKGTELVIEAHRLLREAKFDFRGNIESNKLMLGATDVVVTDGYTGNIVLKLIEGLSHVLAALESLPQLDDDQRQSLRPVLGVLLQKFSYEVYGGALLLGVDGVVIISHGRSSSLAIQNAVQIAHRQVHLDIPGKLQAELSA